VHHQLFTIEQKEQFRNILFCSNTSGQVWGFSSIKYYVPLKESFRTDLHFTYGTATLASASFVTSWEFIYVNCYNGSLSNVMNCWNLKPRRYRGFSLFQHVQISTVWISHALVANMVHFHTLWSRQRLCVFDFVALFLIFFFPLMTCTVVGVLIDYMYDLLKCLL
jgi:hypothetical protein